MSAYFFVTYRNHMLLNPTFKYRFTLTCFSILFFSLTAQQGIAQDPEKKGGKKQQEQKGEKAGKKKRITATFIEPGNIILGSPTASAVTANILLDDQSEAYIAYGTGEGNLTKRTPTYKSQQDTPLEITLEDLISNTRYFYQLHYRADGEKEYRQTAVSWFATQRKAGSSFCFGVQGDSHPEREGKMFSPVLYKQTIDSVSARKPDFYFMLGDDFSIDHKIEKGEANKNTIEKVYQVQRYYLGRAGKNPPLFLVNGNHEQAARYLLDGTASSPAVLAGNARKKYFPLPEPGKIYSGDTDSIKHIGLLKDYYAFEWGDALFIVIDPYWHSDSAVDNQPGHDKKNGRNLWDITLGKTQYNWLKQTLESSRAKYKFVFAHHVSGTGRGGVERAKYFEWGGYSQNGEWQFDKKRSGWALPIHQLMVKNKVTIFFQGHDHIFARQELDGVIYQSVPNPADDTYTAFNREAYTTGDILPNSGFLNVTVTPGEVKVEYIRSYLEGTVSPGGDATRSFSYVVKKGPGL